MIRRIKLLRNVGVFANATASCELNHLVLVYAENAHGKTTLAEILRSLDSDDHSTITKKQSFGAQQEPHVILECDDLPTVMFQDGHWPDKRPLVKVFDESFVTDNVYSGLDIGPKHRQNLHDFVLGRQGVTLSLNRKKLAQGIEQCNKDMGIAEDAVPDSRRGGLTMDRFCDLDRVPDIDTEISNAQTALDVARDADTIHGTPTFETINLPAFDELTIRTILQRGLQDLDMEAAASVAKHIVSLGDGGERWIASGVEYMRDDVQACPFCGQATTDVSLIKHYRAYFGEAYEKLKSDIVDALNNVRIVHSRDVQTTFERTVGNNEKVGRVWTKYGLQVPDVDTKPIMDEWTRVLDKIKQLLDAKQAAPLEPMALDSDLLESYERHRQQIADINIKLGEHNDKINQIKNANSADIQTASDKLRLLEATKERHLPATASWCDKYIRAKAVKNEAEEKKQQVTEQLEEYRNKVFPALQEEVNHYLSLFGVKYIVQDFVSSNIRGGSSSNYSVHVGDTSIDAREPKSEDDPTIGSTLSTSERNTLALAIFFSSLAKDENLADTVVVVDDPVSSFDANRYLATIQVLRHLAEKANQMIILSHNSMFLDRIWKRIEREDCLPLTIIRDDEGSVIRDWNVGQESNAEQAEWQRLLENYTKSEEEDSKAVAEAIRPYLETVLEAAHASHYNGGKPIESFFSECKDVYDTPDEILDRATVDELRDIFEYANPFMHGSSQNAEGRRINDDELRTYARRALNVAKMSTGRLSHTQQES